VRHARIRRVWPDALRVQIEEQQPLALWNENQMINTWGEAFTANQGELADDAGLPQLNGPATSERLVVQRYAEIARWFAPLNLRVQEVTLSPRYAWEVRLSDGMHLSLGRDPAADVADPHGRSGALPFAARIERFVQAWPHLAERLEGRAISNADLRYSNGFAITLAPVSNTSTK
jgi:cell division protein FtsQ